MMHGTRSRTSPGSWKPANKAETARSRGDLSVELNQRRLVERRRGREGIQASKARAGRKSGSVSTGAGTHTESGEERKKERFTALFHHISIDLLERRL